MLIYFIIVVAICMFFFVRSMLESYFQPYTPLQWVMNILGALLLSSVIGAFAAMIIGGAIGNFFNERITYHYYIETLRDDSQVSGSFFLGSGSIEESPVYYMYVKNDDGTLTLTSESAYAKLRETDEQEPQVRWTDNKEVMTWWYYVTKDDYKEDLTIVVPKDTVVKSFKVND